MPAGFEDVLGERGVGSDAGGGDDVGDDDGAGDRALARAHQRHAHRRMAVERGLDLLGMHLLAADIDDAAAPPDEMVAAVAPLDHVAGIDEAVLAGQRRRSEPPSTFISTGPPPRSTSASGKPASPSPTANATPASVEAKAWAMSAAG